MPLEQAKQINKLLAGWVPLSNQTVSSANSLNVTSALTTALSTAGNNSTSVPLNANGSSTAEGVITSSSTNEVPIYAYPAGTPISIAGAQVYGLITQSGGVYTVSFYTLVSGTQTAATLNQAINLLIPYSFTFSDLPYTALLQQSDSNPGASAGGSKVYNDIGVTCTATNTISNLTKTPADPNSVTLYVNGQALSAGNSFSVSGQSVTLSSGQISFNGYNITTTDNIFATYSV